MVKVVDFKSRRNSEGKEFFVLVVQGGIRPVISKETGKIYFTISKANVPTTFDEEVCSQLIGEEIEGTIEKVECEPYKYEVESTGEILELTYRYEFVTEEQKIVDEHLIDEAEVI